MDRNVAGRVLGGLIAVAASYALAHSVGARSHPARETVTAPAGATCEGLQEPAALASIAAAAEGGGNTLDRLSTACQTGASRGATH